MLKQDINWAPNTLNKNTANHWSVVLILHKYM